MYLERMPQSDAASATNSDETERSILYRAKVNELLALAEHTSDPTARTELVRLCMGYRLLAARLNSFHPTPVERLLGDGATIPREDDPQDR
jgi:hypothetical protein